MILTCPNCATRYMVDPAHLGGDGRVVRCGKCGHTWHQDPPADAPLGVESIPLSIDPRPLPPGSNLPMIVRPRPERDDGGGIGWIVLLIAIAVVLAGGYFGRATIVQSWPPALELYRLAGFMRAPPGEGLSVRNVTTTRALENNIEVLTVQGEVINQSKLSQEVPSLTVTLWDARHRDVQHWSFKIGEPKLLPGEISKFSTRVENPSSEATDLAVTFGPGKS